MRYQGDCFCCMEDTSYQRIFAQLSMAIRSVPLLVVSDMSTWSPVHRRETEFDHTVLWHTLDGSVVSFIADSLRHEHQPRRIAYRIHPAYSLGKQ